MWWPKHDFEYAKVPPPKNLRDVPRFLKAFFGGFFGRFWYIIKLIWRTGPWILFVMSGVAIFQGITPAISSVISKDILNELHLVIQFEPKTPAEFFTANVFYLLIALFVLRILRRIVTSINNSVRRIAGERVVRVVKLQIMEKSKELDIASYDMPAFYEKLENANREAGNRPITILSETFTLISTVIEFASYIAILAAAPELWWSSLVIIAVSLPSAIINFIYRRKNFQYVRFRAKERRQMNYYSGVLVNKDIVKEVRMLDLSDFFIGRYKEVFDKYYKGLRRLILSEHAWHVGLGILASLINFALYSFIALQVFTGKMLIGDYTLYTGAILSIATCITTLISNSASIYEGTLFIDNLIYFLKEPATVVSRLPEPLPVPDEPHVIEFVNVSFRYPGTERDVIRNVNLKLTPGQSVVLVGLNGAGKTTLLKLLTRLYDPTEGYILLDGKDLRDYDLKDIYRMFGVVFQDFGKYAVTVSENISFGAMHRPVDESAIRAAAEQSDASDFISRLPREFDTPLMRMFEQDGIELSGGQWQKLAVARAFYADSEILILDEPTAALDPLAEQEIYNQFDRLRKDKTTIFVSHRLSCATTADMIVVLEDGQVVECGDHEDLMALHGRYHRLFTVQADRYERRREDHNLDPHGDRPRGDRPRRRPHDFE